MGVEQQEKHDPDSTLFVGAVTTEVQIQNEECYVMLLVKGHFTKLKIDKVVKLTSCRSKT